MKTRILYIIFALLFFNYPVQCQQPAITMTTSTPYGFPIDFILQAKADHTPVYIDFGDGTLLNNEVNITYTHIYGTVLGPQIKIYSEDISGLNCQGCKLISLDVTNDSIMTSLTCNNNYLTELDVSKNVLLEFLICTDNLLESLDLSKNTVLTYLFCSSNKLTSLELTNNIDLTNLECHKNKLTNLDVSNNSSLLVLVCDDNLLTELNVTKNGALQNLNCGSNKLNSIEVTKNPDLISFDCNNNYLDTLNFNNNAVLQIVNCNNNRLRILDFSHNPVFESLYCIGNLISELVIPEDRKLTFLVVQNNKLNFATLPPYPSNQGDFSYAPQKPLQIKKEIEIDSGLDLSTQYLIEGNITDFIWKTQNGSILIQDIDYSNNDGVFVFLRPQIDSVYCEMTNNTFPDFSGDLVLKTTYTKINGPDKPYIVMKTAKKIGSVISFILKSDYDTCVVQIDYGDGIMVYDTIGSVEKIIHNTLVATHTVYIYGGGITYLDCGNNQLTSLNIFNDTTIESLVCSNNRISALELSNNPKLKNLDCSHNRLTFSTLPPANELWTSYNYTPQEPIAIDSITDISYGLDLSDQYLIDGNITDFCWKTLSDNTLVEGFDYVISTGITTFLHTQADSVYCEMTNSSFPEFTATNPLRTSCSSLSSGNRTVISVTTLNNPGSIISFTLAAYIDNIPVKIDYGDSTFVEDTIGTNETLFLDTLVGSQTVNIYGQGITLLNCDNNRLLSIDIINDTSLLTLSLKNNLLSEFDMDNLVKLKSLDLSNNLIDFIGVGIYGGNLDTLICKNNRLNLATLPFNFGFWAEYQYAPQQPIQLPKTIELGKEIDLSSQNIVDIHFGDPVESRYTWKTQSGITLSGSDDYTRINGITIFKVLWEDSVYCEIKNNLFPDFSGSNVLRTTFIKLEPYNSLENLQNPEPRIYSDKKYIYIDSPFDAQVSIFDISGRLLINESLGEGFNIIQMQRTGLYFVKLISRNHSFTRKIYVQ